MITICGVRVFRGGTSARYKAAYSSVLVRIYLSTVGKVAGKFQHNIDAVGENAVPLKTETAVVVCSLKSPSSHVFS